MAETTKQSTWAVILVHGVGDTGPGRTLEAFLPALSNTNRALTEITQPETVLLPEPAPGLPTKDPVPPPAPGSTSGVLLRNRFPAHVRRFAVDDARPGAPTRAIFAEVFWADQSTAGEGTLRLLLRLFTAIFDLRYLPDIAARCENVYTSRWLRLILFAISTLLCGPVAGFTAFLAYLLAARYGVSKLPEWLRPSADYGPFGLALIGLALSLVLLGAHRRWKWRRHWAFVIKSIIAAALIDVVAIRVAADSFSANLELLLRILGGLFLAVGALMTIAFVAWLLARIESSRKKVVRFLPALDAALAANLLQVGLWLIVVPSLGIAMLKTWAPDIVSGQDPLFDGVFLSFTQNLALAFLVAACAALVWAARRQVVRHLQPPYTAADEKRIPRLLVHNLIVTTIVVVSLVGVVATWWALLSGTARFGGWLNGYRGIVLSVILVVVVLAGGVLRKGLNNGLHILMDVVSHFYQEDLPIPSLKEISKLDPDIFAIQQRLEARFRAVLEHVLGAEPVTHLTIVAHSQGTMIALDVLWLEWAARRLRNIEVDLVTMGSPLTHLYQHYFPDRYPALFTGSTLNPDWGAHLTSTVTRWLNVYRVDDFVGTHIDGQKTFPRNRCIPGSGHTGYWSQDEALREMSAYLPGGAARAESVLT